ATSSPADNIASTSWIKVSGPNPAISGQSTLNLSLSKMPVGTYVFRLTVKDKQNRQVTDEVTIVVASSGSPSQTPEPSTPSEPATPPSTPSTGQQSVVSFSLMNADTDKEIKVISNGEVLNLATLPTRNLNIRVNTNPTTVGSVKMELTGKQTKTQTETDAPYALFGDNNGDYKNWTPSTGSYSLKATPYTDGAAKGTAGKALTINFTVVSSSTSPSQTPESSPSPDQQSVVSFSLMNADTDKEIKVISTGAVLNLATLPTRNLNIRVNTNPTTVGSVKMELTGRQTRTQTETDAPYALFADNNGDYKNWTPSTGSYSLKATPYTDGAAKGTAGKALTINFTVVNQSSARISAEDDAETEGLVIKTYPNPFIDSFTLEVKGREDGKLPVVIYDAYGRAVLQLTDVQPGQLVLFGSEYAPGLYLLQVGEGKLAKRHKLMKN
ncbi:PKD domain-containing protein, partial [Larkinella arboricola]